MNDIYLSLFNCDYIIISIFTHRKRHLFDKRRQNSYNNYDTKKIFATLPKRGGKIVAKNKDFENNGLFSIDEIIKILKTVFEIENKMNTGQIEALKRKLQRDFKSRYSSEATYQDGNGKRKYYPRKIVEEYINDEITIRYFQRNFKSKNYRPNKLLVAEQLQEFNEIENEIYKSWDEVGLTKDEGYLLQFDQFNEKKYLRVDELQQLHKKGLILREDLTEEEKEHLKLYEYFLATSKAEDKRIEELFKERKIEIMITALFNKFFTLKENLLKEDISNYVHCGKYDSDLKELSIEDTTTKKQNVTVRRSYERLQDNKNYYTEK